MKTFFCIIVGQLGKGGKKKEKRKTKEKRASRRKK